RCTPDDPRPTGDADAWTVVVKRFPLGADGRDGYVRERTGLALLPATPQLLAADDDHHVLVMTDLGKARTLADVLLDADPDAARAAAVGWAGALGATLAASRSHVDEAEATLVAAGAAPHDPGDAVYAGATRLLRLLGDDAAPSSALEADLAALSAALRADPATRIVTPGDTCPDNALLTPGGWRFLDLERTTVRHVALDAAYALLPFPTCWCLFQPPPGLTDAMFEAFTDALRPAMPEVVDGAGWGAAVDAACGAWVLVVNLWLVDAALAEDVDPVTDAVPPLRARLAARWRWGAERLHPTLPAAADLLARAAAWADDAWGADMTVLPPYPAFEGRAAPA
ncbi:MAG: hypothetical protein H5T83_06285, partial [Actinotalea sp.]|nr:hypothetical protein [Actinotalea sp.]